MSLRITSNGKRSPVNGTYAFPITFGRAADVDIHLNDRWVSRQHCIIELVDGIVVLRDLNSTHGTLVNRQPVSTAVLRPGDEVGIGLNMLTVDWDRTGAEGDSSGHLQIPAGIG